MDHVFRSQIKPNICPFINIIETTKPALFGVNQNQLTETVCVCVFLSKKAAIITGVLDFRQYRLFYFNLKKIIYLSNFQTLTVVNLSKGIKQFASGT